MKRILFILLSVLTISACTESFDDSAIQQQLQDHENRIAQLEEACRNLNTNIESLQAIVKALDESDFVTSVTPIVQEEKTIGYTVTFRKSDPITIYLNEVHTPQISVQKDEDGFYYWTVDGNWLLNEKGEKVKAQATDGADGQNGTDGTNGTDGKDGLTPELKIEEGFWYVRYGEGEWTQLGAATPDAPVGDSIFKEVQVGASEVTFVLANGEKIVLPLKSIKLHINFADNQIGILPGQQLEVAYSVEGATEGTMVKALAQNGWKVKVQPTSFEAGKLVVTAPDPLVEDEIIVLVSDGESCTVMSSVNFVKATVNSAIANVELENTAGTFDLTVESNIEYTVEIPSKDQSWLSQVETKSMTSAVLTFSYLENTGVERRSEIILRDVEGNEILSVPVLQKAVVRPEPPVADATWTRITDEANLAAGDIIRLACSSEGKVMNEFYKEYFKPTDAVFTGNTMSDVAALDLVLGGATGAWTFTAAKGGIVAQKGKKLAYGETPTAWRIKFEAEGVADIRCDFGCMLYNANSPRFNVYDSSPNKSMLKVEIYKKNFQAPSENGVHPSITFGETTISEIGQNGAYFGQLYSEASSVPTAVGFQYSTDSTGFENNNMEYAKAPDAQGLESGFFQFVEGLAANTTYYVRASVKLYGTGEFETENKTFYSKPVSFKTLANGASPDPDQPGTDPQNPSTGANVNGYLTNYEVPFADVNMRATQQYSSTVQERGGSTDAYIYDTKAAGQRIVTHTFAKDGKTHRNYTFLYDYEKKLPVWLAYHMNRGYCSTGGNRTDAWAYDPAIPQEHQPNLSKSYGSGYNRGHMLASHSRSAITEANRQTFYYTNMTPQDERYLNTGAGSWNKLESHEMSILPSGNDTLYVVTGCTFDEPVKYITSSKGSRCAVPKECYKCFMMCSFDSNHQMVSAKGIGYLMPNDKNGAGDYAPFAKTIDEIEALTGFNFFANVPKSLQDAAESKKTVL